MHDVNWWLMALSFLLGLVLTFLFMIRRVTREVPIYAALGRGPKVEVKKPVADVKKAAPVVAAAAAAPAVAKVVKDEPYGTATGSTEAAKFAAVAGEPEEGPYGAGSAKAGAGGVGPAGWTIKGNADSGLYHTPASSAYDETIAELWFADEATAQAAGFKKFQ